MKMKIIMLCSSAEVACGIGDFNKELSLALEEIGEEVYVTTEIDMGSILEIKPDVVLIQHEYSLYSFIDLQKLFVQLRKRGIKNYIIQHGWNDAFEDMNKLIETQSGGIIVLNENFKRRLMERGVPERKINVIPMGSQNFEVKKKAKENSGDNEGKEGKEDKEDKNKIIGMFGFLEPHKGFIEGIRAVEFLAANYGYNPTVVLIAFSKQFLSSNQYEVVLDKVIKESGLNVIRVGRNNLLPRDKVLSTLSVCDCLLYPYLPDIFTYSSSAALRDGIASRSPAITSDITFFADVPSIDEDAEKGFIIKVPTTNPEDLASAMIRIFEDSELRDRILKNTELFIKKHSWLNIAMQYSQLFKAETATEVTHRVLPDVNVEKEISATKKTVLNWRHVSHVNVGIGIPTYNDAERIIRLTDSISDNTDKDRFSYQIVALDDGSTDKEMLNILKSELKERQIPLTSIVSTSKIPDKIHFRF